jgi:indolepyruvate ferredoxin oxidoreductase
VIGGDLVVTAGARTLGLMTSGRTGAVVNAHEIVTGDFTRNRDFRLPADRLRLAIEARLRDRVSFLDASHLAEALLGDSIYSNMCVLGAAWQKGLVPLSRAAICKAIELNGAAVEGNLRAFEIGRLAAQRPSDVGAILEEKAIRPLTLREKIDFRTRHLTDYRDAAYAGRYLRLVRAAPEELTEVVVLSFHRLLAYKDEYEVARLHLATADRARALFEGDLKLSFHLAPPLLGGRGPDGRPKKREFGAWMLGVFRLLARMKGLRGTAFDPFGHTAERRAERAAIAEYEADMAEAFGLLSPATAAAVKELAALPMAVRGFGPVRRAAAEQAAARRSELLDLIRAGGAPVPMAAE